MSQANPALINQIIKTFADPIIETAVEKIVPQVLSKDEQEIPVAANDNKAPIKQEGHVYDISQLFKQDKKDKDQVSNDELLLPSKKSDESFMQYARKNYHHWFNWATIGLHTLGAMTPFISSIPEPISKFLKKSAVLFSQWGVPAVKAHTGFEAFKGKRLFESLARFTPATLLPTVPFFNFQIPYGLSSGVNVVLEHMHSRTGELKKEDGFVVNNKKVFDALKSMVNDLLFNKDTDKKEKQKLGLALSGAGFMISGALPVLLFARNQLNTPFAKIFGTIRSIGGFLGDLSIIMFSSKPTEKERKKEQLVGSLYLVPTFMDLAQRWIDQSSDANEIFNHAKTAINTIAEVLWSSFSTDRNIKQEEKAAA